MTVSVNGRRRGRVAALMVVVSMSAAACSDDGTGSTSSTVANSTASSGSTDGAVTTAGGGDTSITSVPPPIVDQIDAAVAALESTMGGPQQYFEINATSQLINLFVALNDGAVVQPWVYVDGILTDSEGQAVESGGTFTADLLDFDAATIFSKLAAEVPGATIETFYVHGDSQGNVLYGALVTSSRGGALEIILGPDGAVKSVDPVS